VLPVRMPAWQVYASKITHWMLYGLIFAMPISGWLMSSASAYSVSWFNLVELPDLVKPNETLKEVLISVHHLLATTLFLVAGVHLLAALKHHFFDHDDVLKRMLSTASGSAFLALVVVAIWLAADVGRSGSDPGATVQAPTVAAQSSEVAPIAPASSIAPWQIDYAASHIHFSAEQAGAGFEGVWQDWRGDIRFDPAAPAASSAAVEVDVASVSTGDSDRDETLLAPGWFSALAFPTATFTTDAFTATADGRFVAAASLTIKDVVTPIQFVFSARPNDTGDGWILDGSTRLDRLAMHLGTGEWADPTWVGQFVDVAVHVEARTQP
jgi:polyisoprenoid-binding protein YceI